MIETTITHQDVDALIAAMVMADVSTLRGGNQKQASANLEAKADALRRKLIAREKANR